MQSAGRKGEIMFKKIIAGILCAASIITVACSCSASNNNPSANVEGNTQEVKLEKGDLYAVMTVKDFGEITIKLYPDAAPVGVKNFTDLVNAGYYNGKTFHRVVANFMEQGGKDFSGETTVEKFDIETNYKMRHFYGALCYANALGKNTTEFYLVNNKESQDFSKFDLDTISNNASAFDEAAEQYKNQSQQAYDYYKHQAQYYRNLYDFVKNADEETIAKYKEVGGTPSLDGNYTVFGQTVDGFDVIDKIAAVEVEANENMNDEKSKPTEDIIIESIVIKEYE